MDGCEDGADDNVGPDETMLGLREGLLVGASDGTVKVDGPDVTVD